MQLEHVTSIGGNKMYKKFMILCSTTLLAGCGGGGTTSTSQLDQSYDSSGENSSVEIRQYSAEDGKAYLLALKGHIDGDVTPNDTKYYFTLTSDKNFVEDSFSGAIVWTQASGETLVTERGTGYRIERTGVNNSGEEFFAMTEGLNLNLSGSEYVSFSLVEHEDEVSLLTTGTTVKSLPSGAFTYDKDGFGVIGLQETFEVVSNVNLTADFDNLTGNLLAVSDNLYISSTGFDIDTDTGSFSGGASEIGERATTFSTTADLIGAFAGSNAGAAHGYVYNSSDDIDNGVGIFVVQR